MKSDLFVAVLTELTKDYGLRSNKHQVQDLMKVLEADPDKHIVIEGNDITQYKSLLHAINRILSSSDRFTPSMFIASFLILSYNYKGIIDEVEILSAHKAAANTPDPYAIMHDPCVIDGMKWKMPTKPVPQSAVQAIVIDVTGKMLVMHRSEKVRSAKNCWSFPSGLHDIGETQQTCVARELHEEYDLEALDYRHVGIYENIAGDPEATEHYHWNVTVVVALVRDVHAAVNKEPDKHDQMIFLEHTDIAVTKDFLNHFTFHHSFADWLHQHSVEVLVAMSYLLAKCNDVMHSFSDLAPCAGCECGQSPSSVTITSSLNYPELTRIVYECGCEVDATESTPEKCPTHGDPVGAEYSDVT